MIKLSVTKITQFSGHKNAIYTVQRALAANSFYSGSADGYVVEWNVETKEDGHVLVNVKKPVYSLLLIPEKNEMLVGTSSGNIHVIDLLQKQEVKNIQAHKAGVFSLTRIGDQIISCGEDGMMYMWDEHLQLKHSVKVSDKSTRVAVYSSKRNELTTGSSDFKIRIYDATDFTLKRTIDAHTSSVFALAYNSDESQLMSGGRDAMLKVWDGLDGYHMVKDIPAHNLHINQIAMHPGGQFFATCSMDKAIRIWDATDFSLLKVIDKAKLEGHASSVNRLLWLDEETLVSCSDDREIMIWKVVLSA